VRLVRESSTFLDDFSGSPQPATATYRIETSAVSSLSFTGSTGTNSLILDFSAGAPFSTGNINFTGAGNNNSLTLLGSPGSHTINVTANTASFDASNITYANLENVTVDPEAGVDALTITGATVSFPTLAAGAGITARTLSNLNIAAGAQLILPSSFNLNGTLDYADRYLATINTLSLTGKLDTGDSDLLLANQTTAAVTPLLKSGFNAPAGYWNGASGILSSTAASDTTHLTTLALLQSASNVSVKYTYYGDADLNGAINGADYQQIDNGFGTHATGWANGDFNYDGVIDGSDYSLIDNAFNQINSTAAAPLAVSAALSPATQSKKTVAAASSAAISAPIFADSNINAWKLYIESADDFVLT
jgi:hypothetical protein